MIFLKLWLEGDKKKATEINFKSEFHFSKKQNLEKNYLIQSTSTLAL